MKQNFYQTHQLKKILLATDNSNECAAAERYAIEFANVQNCELHILRIFDPSVNDVDNEIGYDEYILQYKDQLENELANKFRDITQLKNLKSFFIANEQLGSISATITDYAWTNNIDLIVVGSHGSSGYKMSSFGSTTYALIKASQHPVLSVPSFAQLKKPVKIVFACKGLASEIEKCAWLLSCLGIESNSLELLHVIEEGDEVSMTHFEEMLRKESQTCEIRLCCISGSDIPSALSNFIQMNDANLFVMTGIPKSFFGQIFSESIISRMSYQVQLPLLYLPELQ